MGIAPNHLNQLTYRRKIIEISNSEFIIGFFSNVGIFKLSRYLVSEKRLEKTEK
jgi:hypothetical protein